MCSKCIEEDPEAQFSTVFEFIRSPKFVEALVGREEVDAAFLARMLVNSEPKLKDGFNFLGVELFDGKFETFNLEFEKLPATRSSCRVMMMCIQWLFLDRESIQNIALQTMTRALQAAAKNTPKLRLIPLKEE